MTDPKTISAHNANLTGHAAFYENDVSHSVPAPAYQIFSLNAARLFVTTFKKANPDIQISDAQWTKLIDALSASYPVNSR